MPDIQDKITIEALKKEFAKKDKKPEVKKDEPVIPSIEASPAADSAGAVADDDKVKDVTKEKEEEEKKA